MVVYKTVNKVNGKIYIGKDAKNRLDYIGSGVILKKAIKKYGKKNFKKIILEKCNDLKSLEKREVYWIKFYDSTNSKIGYNLTKGGTGGDTHSLNPNKKNILEKSSRSLKKFYINNKRARGVISERSKKWWSIQENRKLMSSKMLGREITWKHKISNGLFNYWSKQTDRTISESTRRKISQKNKGSEIKKVSAETEKQILNLYEEYGPNQISKILEKEGHNISTFLIRRILKNNNIYISYQKGLGRYKKNIQRKFKKHKIVIENKVYYVVNILAFSKKIKISRRKLMSEHNEKTKVFYLTLNKAEIDQFRLNKNHQSIFYEDLISGFEDKVSF